MSRSHILDKLHQEALKRLEERQRRLENRTNRLRNLHRKLKIKETDWGVVEYYSPSRDSEPFYTVPPKPATVPTTTPPAAPPVPAPHIEPSSYRGGMVEEYMKLKKENDELRAQLAEQQLKEVQESLSVALARHERWRKVSIFRRFWNWVVKAFAAR